jgi:ABC-type glutathione transport system ATPase component
MDKHCIIFRGISGAGKSTLAELFGGVVCCADDFFVKDGEYKFDPTLLKRAHEVCREKFEDAVKKGEPRISVSNTNTQSWEFEFYSNFAKENGYKVFSVIVENRHGNENVHGVPSEVLKKQKARFEVKL